MSIYSRQVPISGYDGLYSITETGEVFSHRVNRFLKVQKGGRYYAVHLTDGQGRERTVNLHRLLAEAFIPNPDGHPHVLHHNDNKMDNTLDNLYWGTPKQNRIDSVVNGVHGYAKRDKCSRGHEYTEENTYHSKTGRVCRKCRLIYKQNAGEKK